MAVCGISIPAQIIYPIPAKTPELLFYMQRSHNRNTIMYNVNWLSDGRIDAHEPVHVFWKRYEENSQNAELSFIQRRAFGLSYTLMENSKDNYILHFNSFKKRAVYLFLLKEKVYKAYIRINGELCELEKLYVKSQNNSLGMPITIGYVEITGVSMKNGLRLTERITP